MLTKQITNAVGWRHHTTRNPSPTMAAATSTSYATPALRPSSNASHRFIRSNKIVNGTLAQLTGSVRSKHRRDEVIVSARGRGKGGSSSSGWDKALENVPEGDFLDEDEDLLIDEGEFEDEDLLRVGARVSGEADEDEEEDYYEEEEEEEYEEEEEEEEYEEEEKEEVYEEEVEEVVQTPQEPIELPYDHEMISLEEAQERNQTRRGERAEITVYEDDDEAAIAAARSAQVTVPGAIPCTAWLASCWRNHPPWMHACLTLLSRMREQLQGSPCGN